MNVWVDFKGAQNQDEERKLDGLCILMKSEIELSDDRRGADGEEVGGWR